MIVSRHPRKGLVRDTNTRLLLHCNGPDAGTTFPDSAVAGEAPHAITVAGDAQVDADYSPFGGGSLYCDGTGDYIQLASTADINSIGFGNFTLECQFRAAAVATEQYLIGLSVKADNDRAIALAIEADGSVGVYCYTATTFHHWVISATGLIVPNVWYHLAEVRNGANLTGYLNGVSFGNDATLSNYSVPNYNELSTIGSRRGNTLFTGHIAEVRFSWAARWTANFTPPACKYSAYL